MKTIAVTIEEGGSWISFDAMKFNVVHSILFEDGTVWDAQSGFREGYNAFERNGAASVGSAEQPLTADHPIGFL